MQFPTTELLGIMLGVCLALACLVLVRDLIPRWRQFAAKRAARKETSLAAPGLSELENELE